MDDRRGSITVTALVGTGAATLGFALFGLAGVGSDLRAADAVRPSTPRVATQDLSQSLRQERRSPKWDGTSPLPSNRAPAATPSPTPQPQPQQEL
jgi:hypothetical protein